MRECEPRRRARRARDGERRAVATDDVRCGLAREPRLQSRSLARELPRVSAEHADDHAIQRALRRQRLDGVCAMGRARSVVAGRVPHDHASARRRSPRRPDARARSHHEAVSCGRRRIGDRERSGQLRRRRVQPDDHAARRAASRRDARREQRPGAAPFDIADIPSGGFWRNSHDQAVHTRRSISATRPTTARRVARRNTSPT